MNGPTGSEKLAPISPPRIARSESTIEDKLVDGKKFLEALRMDNLNPGNKERYQLSLNVEIE